MRVRVGALCTCLGLVACGGGAGSEEPALERAAIFGGSAVEAGEWESVVAVQLCTGALVAETLVLYAAHCGTSAPEVVIGSDIRAPRLRVPVNRCQAHPDAALGNGRDVAYCLLAEPIRDVPAIELLEDGESGAVEVGAPITQVGYGLDSDLGSFGIKRQTTGILDSLGDDFVVRGTDGGTCSGDSGGPALVPLARAGAGEPTEWRLLGLLSAGTSYDCGVTTDHYTHVHAVRSWVESETGIDLSPNVETVPTAKAAEVRVGHGDCALSRATGGEPFWFGVLGVASALGAFRLLGRRGVSKSEARRCAGCSELESSTPGRGSA